MILDRLCNCYHICMTTFAHRFPLAQTAVANTATPANATAANVSAFAAKRQSLALTAGEQRDTLMIRAAECNVLVRVCALYDHSMRKCFQSVMCIALIAMLVCFPHWHFLHVFVVSFSCATCLIDSLAPPRPAALTNRSIHRNPCVRYAINDLTCIFTFHHTQRRFVVECEQYVLPWLSYKYDTTRAPHHICICSRPSSLTLFDIYPILSRTRTRCSSPIAATDACANSTSRR